MKRVIDIPDGEYDFIKFLGANYTNYQTTELLYRAVRSSKTYEERPHGKWIKEEDTGLVGCSNCHIVWLRGFTKFCPNCGADMRGDKKNEAK